MTAPDFIAAWTAATGQGWRVLPYQVQQEADVAAKAGFTAEEIKLVVSYVRKQIARNEGGYNAQSLLWRVMAADGWGKFQERLSLAQEALQRAQGGKPKPDAPQTVRDGTGTVTRIAEPMPDTAVNVIDVCGALSKLAQDIGRQSGGLSREAR